MVPTDEQVESFERDGFVVIPDVLDTATVGALRARFEPLFFDHAWVTGTPPDEVNYTHGVTSPDRTRQLCNTWRADPTVAATVLSPRIGELVARLAGLDGVRILQDNVLWKPPNGLALGAHQDNAYNGWLDPVNMTTCWMALDDTAADAGTVWYVRGSHRWPPAPMVDNFHAPDDWLAHARASAPSDADFDSLLTPIEVSAGGVAVHHGWTFHGSPPNASPTRQRRSVVAHFGWIGSRHHSTVRHPIYSREAPVGGGPLDDRDFPVVWHESL